jgi:hypothetical protein
MINILPNKTDDIAFTRIVTDILAALVLQNLPQKVYVVKVDRRFDFKWKGFKGKWVGAVGAWNDEKLRIPPFNPKKIVSEQYFEKSGDRYIGSDARKLHIHQRSEFNHERRIESTAGSGLFIWYSGETLINPHASVMAYIINDSNQTSWFVSFICKDTWRIKESLGISEQEARFLFEESPLSV